MAEFDAFLTRQGADGLAKLHGGVSQACSLIRAYAQCTDLALGTGVRA